MLLVRVFCDLGLCDPFDPRPYASDWHLHRGESAILVSSSTAATSGPWREWATSPCSGMGAAGRTGGSSRAPSPLTIVHAYSPAGCVLEEAIAENSVLRDPARAMRIFSLWSDDREDKR